MSNGGGNFKFITNPINPSRIKIIYLLQRWQSKKQIHVDGAVPLASVSSADPLSPIPFLLPLLAILRQPPLPALFGENSQRSKTKVNFICHEAKTNECEYASFGCTTTVYPVDNKSLRCAQLTK